MNSIVNLLMKMYGVDLTGWNTKFGAAATTVLALGTMLGCLVEPLQRAADGDYIGAVHSFDKPTFMTALAGLAAIKTALGMAKKIEKAAPPGSELHADVQAAKG